MEQHVSQETSSEPARHQLPQHQHSRARQLLVNADDLGLSTAINSGIIRSHVEGITASTSLVASGAAFDQALELIQHHPTIGVGVHLTLVEEKALTGGWLPQTYAKLMKGVVTGQIKLGYIEREFRAQIEKCLSAGIKITHLDSHQHTHALPPIFRIALRLANEYGISGIRIPRGWPRVRDLSVDRFAPKCVLCMLAHMDSMLPRGACKTTDRFAGLFETGVLSEDRLLRILNSLRPGTTELVCHPGFTDTTGRYANWSARRETELATLTSPLIKDAICHLGIEIINYGRLNFPTPHPKE